MESTKPLQIDVFSDVVCPWCFLGQQRLDRVLESLDPPVPVQVTHRPFFLDPDAPPEGDDIPARLRRKYGVAPEQLWARLEAEARKSDLELDLSKQRFSYPTARADIDRLIGAEILRAMPDVSPKAFYAPEIMQAAYGEP